MNIGKWGLGGTQWGSEEGRGLVQVRCFEGLWEDLRVTKVVTIYPCQSVACSWVGELWFSLCLAICNVRYIKYRRWQMGREGGECWLIMLDSVCLWFWTLTQCRWDICKCNLVANAKKKCWGLEKAAAKIKLKVKPTTPLLLFFCHVSCHSIDRRAG
jgi:hypothetical protein